jgi:hypothetical protein
MRKEYVLLQNSEWIFVLSNLQDSLFVSVAFGIQSNGSGRQRWIMAYSL